MTTKFEFVKKSKLDVPDEIAVITKTLPEDRGEMVTNGMEATVSYRFDKGDCTIELGIDEQWFGIQDITELQKFLKAVKKQLKKVSGQ